MFLANPQILKVGWNVTQDLLRLERESQGSNPRPYAGGIELAKLAKGLGVISDARTGLADICAVVLGVRLDKTTPVRLSSNWDSLSLSPQQVEYAAADALVALQVYHRLSQIPVPKRIQNCSSWHSCLCSPG
jgi:ribonuclease D